ncbi:ComEC/Rec2 family competence protein [Roseiflexus castenholzii]|uniref:ComEC/Rec2 family competence protein n=1 Tax=Roseiflexus castenholzii TaxID=120962 RepID=UPI003C79FB13
MAAPSSDSGFLRRFAPRVGLIIAALLGIAWTQRPDGRLHVFLPALTGDAALVQTPDGRYLLIDGGADPDALVAALGRRLPFWQRELALVVVTSPDGQRLLGQVAVLERYRAQRALAPPNAVPNATFDAWRRTLTHNATPVHTLRAGQRLAIDGVTLHTLDCTDQGALLRLDYGATSVVFAHSATPDMIERQAPDRAALLVYPWQHDPHALLVESLHPAVIVYSDGYQTRHAPQQTYHERAIGGARLYHERVDGDIDWISDGRRAWVVTSAQSGR